MLNPKVGVEMYPDWLSCLKPKGARDAFVYLVGAAACLRMYHCHAQLKGKNGPIRDFRFMELSGAQPYSFITNQNSLLFYLRKPSRRTSPEDLVEIQTTLPQASHNPKGEITVPITTLAQARLLWSYLGLE